MLVAVRVRPLWDKVRAPPRHGRAGRPHANFPPRVRAPRRPPNPGMDSRKYWLCLKCAAGGGGGRLQHAAGAGEQGGNIVAEGTWKEVSSNSKSITGQYLSGKQIVPYPKVRRKGNGENIVIRGAKENNLKNQTVSFPLGKLISITGVSGSGKSTLVTEILSKAIKNEFSKIYLAMPKICRLTYFRT